MKSAISALHDRCMSTLTPETERRLGNLNNLGRIHSVNEAEGTCRVEVGDNLTDWIPFRSARAGAVKIWTPPSVGEQVEVVSTNGELEAAYVGGSIHCDDNAIPDNPKHAQIHLPDGAVFRYDHETSTLHVSLPEASTINLNGQHLNLTGSGSVQIAGQTIDLNGQVLINGKPYDAHTHDGVQTGSGRSGGVSP